MRLRDALVLAALAGCKNPGGAVGENPPDVGDGQGGWTVDALDISVAPTGYSTERVMVRGVSAEDLADVADDLGVELVPAGPSGWSAIRVPDNAHYGDFMARLRADSRVTDALPAGLIAGAGHGDDHGNGDGHGNGNGNGNGNGHGSGALQWHLDAAGVKNNKKFPDVTVAVLDTGVAYEDWIDGSGKYIQARSLKHSRIVAPWDFVNEDAHANDDHQHGTFMATIVAGQGNVKGVAPRATLMPIKVLDEHNAGDELYLVDGIYHAVDNGAEIVNLSLSFGPSYVPSRPLQEALEYAHDTGVVVIAASGNEGRVGVSWPSASPLVISVGASERTVSGPQQLAVYSNRSPKVDVVAPGGDLSTDVDGDGLVDGIVSETIDLGDPTHAKLWMFAGTSASAAIVSGAAARLLDGGASPEDVPALLSAGAKPFDDGLHALAGGGGLDVSGSLSRVSSPPAPVAPQSIAMFSYLVRNGISLIPTARLTVVDADGQPVVGKEVMGTLWGEGGGAFSCVTSECGSCTVSGPATIAVSRNGNVRGLGWAFRAEAVVDGGGVARPAAALFPSQELDAVTRSLRQDSQTSDGVLAFSWDDNDDAVLGSVGAGYSVVDLASGLSAAPMSVVYNPAALSGRVAPVYVPIDGQGLSSIPVGNLRVTVVQPTGMNLKLAAIDGGGASNTDLNFSALDMFGDACTSSSTALWIDSTNLPATDTGELLATGGWETPDGFAGASLVGAEIAAPSSQGSTGASRTGAIPLP